MHIQVFVRVFVQTTHPATYSGVHISPGFHECGESGRAIDRAQAFSFVAFKILCRSMLLFSQGGATNPHPFVAKSLSRSLSPLARPVSYQDRHDQHSESIRT